MKKTIRKLLPQDTRTIEFNSSFGMMLLSSLLFYGVLLREDVSDIDVAVSIGWVAIFIFLFGFIQFIVNFTTPHIFAARAILCWLAGSFWIWLAFTHPLTVLSIPTLLLGTSNLIAFLLNTMSSSTWKQ